MNKQEALDIIYKVIDDGEWPLEKQEDSVIFGKNATLDSLGVVSFIIDIEIALRAAGTPLIFANDKAMSRYTSPFRNVGVLADYIVELTQ